MKKRGVISFLILGFLLISIIGVSAQEADASVIDLDVIFEIEKLIGGGRTAEPSLIAEGVEQSEADSRESNCESYPNIECCEEFKTLEFCKCVKSPGLTECGTKKEEIWRFDLTFEDKNIEVNHFWANGVCELNGKCSASFGLVDKKNEMNMGINTDIKFSGKEVTLNDEEWTLYSSKGPEVHDVFGKGKVTKRDAGPVKRLFRGFANIFRKNDKITKPLAAEGEIKIVLGSDVYEGSWVAEKIGTSESDKFNGINFEVDGEKVKDFEFIYDSRNYEVKNLEPTSLYGDIEVSLIQGTVKGRHFKLNGIEFLGPGNEKAEVKLLEGGILIGRGAAFGNDHATIHSYTGESIFLANKGTSEESIENKYKNYVIFEDDDGGLALKGNVYLAVKSNKWLNVGELNYIRFTLEEAKIALKDNSVDVELVSADNRILEQNGNRLFWWVKEDNKVKRIDKGINEALAGYQYLDFRARYA
ncbi:hypothetical protein ACFLZZ_03930 [Nanoarchaeota archaeon]